MKLLKIINRKYLKIIGVFLIFIVSNALTAQSLHEKIADSLYQISFEYLNGNNFDSASIIANNGVNKTIFS